METVQKAVPFRKSGRIGEKGVFSFVCSYKVKTFGIHLKRLVLKRASVFHFSRLFYDCVRGVLLYTVE